MSVADDLERLPSVPGILILRAADLYPVAVAAKSDLDAVLAASPLPAGEYVALDVPKFVRFTLG